MSANLNDDIAASAALIRAQIRDLAPRIAVVLGSGLGGLVDRVEDAVTLSYAGLPGFPRPGVEGHAGLLVAGRIEGVPVLFLKGRVHFYEGAGPDPLKIMIRSLRAAGIDTLFLSNAAGSLHPDIPAGHIMAIADHINFLGTNPLMGPNDDEWGPRFLSMDNAWDRDLRALLMAAAEKLSVPMIAGVYAGFLGPSFETPAEVRMAKLAGADSVGMSTVADCIIAHHCGMKVVGCSAITNLAAGIGDPGHTHEGTLKGAALAAEKLSAVVIAFLKDWHAQRMP